jgi:hypothetical protein
MACSGEHKWNTKWNAYLYIANSRRGMFAFINDYLFLIMLDITICLYFNLIDTTFFPFSGGEDTTIEIMCKWEVCNFLFVVVYMIRFC